VWLISDTHFGHSNIIGYCARPFSDVREMNSILIHNWNATVDKRDTVYFLGDILFGYGSGSKDYWLSKLSGNIVYIRGNHDKDKQNTKPYEKLEYKGHRFLLVHDPDDLPFRWDDWIIHGDKHNNNLEAYPFINWKKKTINVCAEVVKYRPINFDKIIEIIKDEKKNNILVLGYNSIT
jgi:calcineurin-like phosphoesterase family protein